MYVCMYVCMYVSEYVHTLVYPAANITYSLHRPRPYKTMFYPQF